CEAGHQEPCRVIATCGACRRLCAGPDGPRRYLCSPKRPVCALCPWTGECIARMRGDQERFPRKSPRPEGKLRRGAAFVVLRSDGRVLLRQRPKKGLLASMTEVPGSEWTHEFNERRARRLAPR